MTDSDHFQHAREGPVDAGDVQTHAMFAIYGSGAEITTIESWFALAPPARGARQWRDGRSAKEVARAWLRDGTPRVPGEISLTLGLQTPTSQFEGIYAIPELVTMIDVHPGQHRNHDLVVLGEARGGRTLLAIEGKADERFGDSSVGDYLDKMVVNPRSKVPKRILGLMEALFGSQAVDAGNIQSDLRRIRYQLIHGLAGALVEGKRRWAEQVVFLVHEFRSEDNRARKYRGTGQSAIAENAQALEDLVMSLGSSPPTRETFLVGPFTVPGGGFVPPRLPFYIGKTITRLMWAPDESLQPVFEAHARGNTRAR